MSKMDELIYSWEINRAFDKFWEENGNSINDLYNNFHNQLKDTFFTAYAQGHGNGYDSGIIDEKMKLMVKLAVHTNLNDDMILKVLEKENEEHFVKALSVIRVKQKNES
ncbi:hypothetical protein [Alkalibacterium sp. MB6]|uniref:hypothetical protein n=1 Tax=Alkalibacterium sp. MB6 TaxID=2081965 RepID=UPI001379E9CD|nr:hypothetical protein [Alkalibacterium sp. MB6]